MNTERIMHYSAVVTFQRQFDKRPDIVRVADARTRVQAVKSAMAIIPGLRLEYINGVELKRVNLVAE